VADAARYSTDELLAIEKGLDRSFAACVAVLLAELGWPRAMRAMGHGDAAWGGVVSFALLVLLVGVYLWFAASVGRAAKAVGSNVLLFVIWVLVAPLLSLVPIPLLSTVLLASPLSLKFLLSGQLRSTIHERTFAG
jgi:hypothetical protein